MPVFIKYDQRRIECFLLTCMSPNTNVAHGIKARLVSFWSFGMYLSFESNKFSLRPSADSQQQNAAFPNLWYTLYNDLKKSMLASIFFQKRQYITCWWFFIHSSLFEWLIDFWKRNTTRSIIQLFSTFLIYRILLSFLCILSLFWYCSTLLNAWFF